MAKHFMRSQSHAEKQAGPTAQLRDQIDGEDTTRQGIQQLPPLPRRALPNGNAEGNVVIMGRNQTVYDAYALLITRQGKATESLPGIITPWDLLPTNEVSIPGSAWLPFCFEVNQKKH